MGNAQRDRIGQISETSTLRLMGFLADRWRRIGTRLYIALGFAVLLTLFSSGVGVYYFERSGDHSFNIQSNSIPVLEAAWATERETAKLQSLGLRLLSTDDAKVAAAPTETVEAILSRVEPSLQVVAGVSELSTDAEEVFDGTYNLAGIIDAIELNRETLSQVNESAGQLRIELDRVSAIVGTDEPAAITLNQALSASDQTQLDSLWDEFVTNSSASGDQSLADLAGGNDGIFAVRGNQLVLRSQIGELSTRFDSASRELDASVTRLVSSASGRANVSLASAGETFDNGRVLLAVISVASVLAATLASWLWVGNGLIRRLSRLSDRMRLMAGGDLETPMPEVGPDEVGELADALEVFRKQALEVQRLNLVEQLYGELRQANEELTRMQARLVANEKLASLGELVSGVAHEISNPLNFIKNFSEGSMELFDELTEILERYRDVVSPEDAEAMDGVQDELSESLNRVQDHGERVLAVVDRMRNLSAVGREPAPTDVNNALRVAAEAEYVTFETDQGGLHVEPTFDLDESLGTVMLSAHDFGEAIRNIVANACFAMRLKRENLGDEYRPALLISSRRNGDEIEIRIRDNGPGIPDDAIDRVFDPFYSTREGVLGAGLGLPLASDVARRAGGDLTVNTVHGEYTEFVMTFPVQESV